MRLKIEIMVKNWKFLAKLEILDKNREILA